MCFKYKTNEFSFKNPYFAADLTIWILFVFILLYIHGTAELQLMELQNIINKKD